jgi:hypothetical protein
LCSLFLSIYIIFTIKVTTVLLLSQEDELDCLLVPVLRTCLTQKLLGCLLLLSRIGLDAFMIEWKPDGAADRVELRADRPRL